MLDLSDHTGLIKFRDEYAAFYHGGCFASLDKDHEATRPTMKMAFYCDLIDDDDIWQTYQVNGKGAPSVLETVCEGILKLEESFGELSILNPKLEVGAIATPFKSD